MTYMYDWERHHVLGGTSHQVGYRGSNGSVYTYAWELEQAEGIPVTDGAAVCCTQLWEYAYLLDTVTDQTYTFAVPRAHERIARVYWDNKALTPQAVRELDSTEALWWREQSEPWIWTRGTQGVRHFDLYPLHAGYQQGYDQRDNEATAVGGEPGALYGLVRELSGTHTYVVETDDPSGIPYGLLRDVSSPDRQYLCQPTWAAPLGTIREWHTSALSVMLWEVVIEDHPHLDDADIPDEVPQQLQKYLRAYVLWRCFSRQGEGQRLDLAAWFEQRWLRGVALMKRLGVVTRRDRGYARQGQYARGRAVPRPRLPSDFPRYIGA
jgi:hypothetical protein